MSEKRFIIKNSNTVSSNYPSERVYDKKVERDLYNSEIVIMLNKLWKENDELKRKNNHETFTFPPHCDECAFLGNNGICGYCKFTLNCYDRKEDLIDGEVLPNCPLKPLTVENRRLKEKYDYDIEDYRQSNAELNKENEQLQEKVKKLESILADDIALRYEIKEAWKQRTEKRW